MHKVLRGVGSLHLKFPAQGLPRYNCSRLFPKDILTSVQFLSESWKNITQRSQSLSLIYIFSPPLFHPHTKMAGLVKVSLGSDSKISRGDFLETQNRIVPDSQHFVCLALQDWKKREGERVRGGKEVFGDYKYAPFSLWYWNEAQFKSLLLVKHKCTWVAISFSIFHVLTERDAKMELYMNLKSDLFSQTWSHLTTWSQTITSGMICDCRIWCLKLRRWKGFLKNKND